MVKFSIVATLDTTARIREENVQAARLGANCREHSIEILQAGDVTLHADGSLAEYSNRGVELRLSPARDEYPGALVDEPARRSESDSATASGDECCLRIELAHGIS